MLTSGKFCSQDAGTKERKFDNVLLVVMTSFYLFDNFLDSLYVDLK